MGRKLTMASNEDDALHNVIGKIVIDSVKQDKQKITITVATIVLTLMLFRDIYSAKHEFLEKRYVIESVQTKLTKEGLFHDFTMAKYQSFGFFDDIRVEDWALMRQRVRERTNHNDAVLGPRSKIIYMDEPNTWYQNNWEPDFSCKHERKVGGLGDGAKWLCDPHRIPRTLYTPEHLSIPKRTQFKMSHTNEINEILDDVSKQKCLVYSFGNRGNLQFEYGLREKIGKDTCEIHVFDDSEHFNSYESLPGLDDGTVFFHPWSLEGSEKQSSARNLLTMQETVEALGHTHMVIDIFKIDCDGCEWDIYKDLFDAEVTIMQILVEVHGSPPNANDFFETLQKHHYVTFHKEPNTLFSGGTCQKYSFLKLAPEFFS